MLDYHRQQINLISLINDHSQHVTLINRVLKIVSIELILSRSQCGFNLLINKQVSVSLKLE